MSRSTGFPVLQQLQALANMQKHAATDHKASSAAVAGVVPVRAAGPIRRLLGQPPGGDWRHRAVGGGSCHPSRRRHLFWNRPFPAMARALVAPRRYGAAIAPVCGFQAADFPSLDTLAKCPLASAAPPDLTSFLNLLLSDWTCCVLRLRPRQHHGWDCLSPLFGEAARTRRRETRIS